MLINTKGNVLNAHRICEWILGNNQDMKMVLCFLRSYVCS